MDGLVSTRHNLVTAIETMLIAAFESLALVLAAIFFIVAFVLLYLVPLAFRATRARFGDWDSERPSFLRTRLAARVGGFVLAMIGIGFIFWTWSEANARGAFLFRMAALGPTLLGLGAWAAIEAPDPEKGRISVLGWVMTATGLIVGLLYTQFLRTGRIPFVG